MARVSFAGVKRVGIALAWLLLFAAISVVVIMALWQLLGGRFGSSWLILENGIYGLAGFGVATIVVGRLLNKYSWDSMGWRPRTGVAFAHGVALGAAMAIAAVALTLVAGATIQFTGDWSAWRSLALPFLLGLLLSALAEELAFRGYPLRRLADAVGVLPAMLLIALVFGVAHAWNPNATVFSIVNIALAALWLSIAFFSRGGMGLAWGAHFGWNAGLAVPFDAPVSGYDFNVPVVEYVPGTHAWLDGGAFGPEGGIFATVVLVAGTLYLLTRTAAFSPQPSDGRGESLAG